MHQLLMYQNRKMLKRKNRRFQDEKFSFVIYPLFFKLG